MTITESGLRLSEADAEILAEEMYSGLLVRLDVRGWLTEAVDGQRVADIKVFLSTESLADLVAQGRALQVALATKARRAAEADAETELKRDGAGALQEMVGRQAARPDEELLTRVVDGLHALPNVSLRRQRPKKNPSVKRGEP